MMALVQSLKEFNKLSAIPFGISSNSIEQHSEFAKNHENFVFLIYSLMPLLIEILFVILNSFLNLMLDE